MTIKKLMDSGKWSKKQDLKRIRKFTTIATQYMMKVQDELYFLIKIIYFLVISKNKLSN